MLLDFEVQRCTRRCAATEREFRPGEWFYSILLADGADVIRRDYGAEAWTGTTSNCIGWWKTRLPVDSTAKPRLAPNDVLLELFDRWADEPEKRDARYVLALLLLRRRVLRLEDVDDPAPGVLQVCCPRRDTTYHVSAVEPTVERIADIQQQLAELLYAGS
jgi:hypothetical protein